VIISGLRGNILRCAYRYQQKGTQGIVKDVGKFDRERRLPENKGRAEGGPLLNLKKASKHKKDQKKKKDKGPFRKRSKSDNQADDTKRPTMISKETILTGKEKKKDNKKGGGPRVEP